MNTKNPKSTQSRFYKSCETFVGKIFKSHPQIYRSIHNLIMRYRKKPTDLLDVYRKLIEVIGENRVLIMEINKLLHTNLKIPFENEPARITNKNEILHDRIQECFKILNKKNPKKFNLIFDSLQIQKNMNIERVFKEILNDEPELYAEIQKTLDEFHFNQNQRTFINENKSHDQMIEENEQLDEYFYNKTHKINKTSRKMSGQNLQIGSNWQNNEHNELGGRNQMIGAGYSGIPVAMKNELHYFENLRESLGKVDFDELIKCIFLYSECIISSNELFKMGCKIIKDQKMFFIFQDIMLSRESGRRKATPFFKPSGEIDLSSKKIKLI